MPRLPLRRSPILLLLAASLVACGEQAAPPADVHAFVETADGLSARSPEQRFEILASERGLSITRGAHDVVLRTRRVGRHDAMQALGTASIEPRGPRVSYLRAGIEEWFQADARGVEHGVELAAPPRGTGVIELEVDVSGALRPLLVGSSIELVDAGGLPRARYADLVVRDDAGRLLSSALAVRGGDIVIRVDDTDARYPIHVDPLVTADQAELRASDGAAGDEFGGTPFETSGGPSVAIDADTAVVAAPWDGGGSGGVYVFVRSGTAWSEQARLVAPAGLAASARFGYSVALAGDRIVVGAPLAGAGRAFVYLRTGGSWAVEQELLAPGVASGDQFGVAVATDGVGAVVGARYDDRGARAGGAAHVFVRSGSTWTHQQRLGASDQAAGDDFGSAVAIDGGTVLVGAIFHSAPSFRGAAWVFTRSGTTWSQQAKLVASDAGALDQFARSLSLDGDVAVVGAPQNQVSVFSQGAAYVYTRSGTSWSETTRLVASDAASNDQLGYAVSVAGGVLAAGARFDDRRAADAGAVYLYELLAAGWTQREERTAPDGAAGDRFGDSVALSADSLVVGAPFSDDRGANAGSAYIVTVAQTGRLGEACSMDSECLGGICVDGVCCDTRCGGGALDCQACSVAAGAMTNGTCAPLRGGVAEARTCRVSAGDCDAAEVCSPLSTSCPADGRVTRGTQCRAAMGDCDAAEVCDGVATSCPGDGRVARGTQCRASAGDCDAVEACDGISTACPPDTRVAPGTECRASMGDCDVAESCDGVATTCPMDVRVAIGTQCRASMGDCDVAEACTGGVSCPVDVLVARGTECRVSMGECDAAEACTGASPSCPADVLVARGTECRASLGECDAAEACDGVATTCPLDARVAMGTQCRASLGECDVAEACDGVAIACPEDARVAMGTECRAAAGECDVAEACDGTAIECPRDVLATAGSECRPATGACDVAESCVGDVASCPADAFVDDGTSCGDGLACDGDEVCAAGACADGAPFDCDDDDTCTADSCAEDEAGPMCAHTPIEDCCRADSDCDDGDPCTADSCVSPACTNEPIPGCGEDGGLGDAAIDEDAAVLEDGAVSMRDGGGTDGGLPDGGGTTEVSPGCGCRAVGASDERLAWLAPALLALVTLRRRRAKR